jgi:hypothetical protein
MEHGEKHFIVMDPDGYILRFMQDLGQKLSKSRLINNKNQDVMESKRTVPLGFNGIKRTVPLGFIKSNLQKFNDIDFIKK